MALGRLVPPNPGARKGLAPSTGLGSAKFGATMAGPRAFALHRSGAEGQTPMLAILWTIIIGFVAGVIAKFIMPGSANEPSGFIMTTLLGIVGAFVATFLGQVTGWYPPNEGAGLIASVVGAVVVLAIFGFIQGRRRSTVL